MDRRLPNALGSESPQRPVARLEHFDEHHARDVFVERLLEPQFLREFNVVPDIGHVDARAIDDQLIVDLHGLQFEDARTAEPAQQMFCAICVCGPAAVPEGLPAMRSWNRTVMSGSDSSGTSHFFLGSAKRDWSTGAAPGRACGLTDRTERASIRP